MSKCAPFISELCDFIDRNQNAIIASGLWGHTDHGRGLNNLTAEKCKVLDDKDVILYPDIRGYDRWKQQAKQLKNCRVMVSDLLETSANHAEMEDGYDLGDYIVRVRSQGLGVKAD